jgi:hypothetical protein
MEMTIRAEKGMERGMERAMGKEMGEAEAKDNVPLDHSIAFFVSKHFYQFMVKT